MEIRSCPNQNFKDSPIALRRKSKHPWLTRPFPTLPASSPATFCLTHHAPSILAFLTWELKSWSLPQGLCTSYFCMAVFLDQMSPLQRGLAWPITIKWPPFPTQVHSPPHGCVIFCTTHIAEIILSIFLCLSSPTCMGTPDCWELVYLTSYYMLTHIRHSSDFTEWAYFA